MSSVSNQSLDRSGQAYGIVDNGTAQYRFAVSGSDGDNHATSPTDFYNISARILGESFIPVTAYSRREELLQNRDFGGTLKTVTTEHGAIAEIKSDVLPTRLQYFHRELTYNESLGLSSGASTQDTFTMSSNYVLTALVRSVFGRQFTDMLSGYKVLSRRFVKSFPAMSRGFEIETELAVHALELRMPCGEVSTIRPTSWPPRRTMIVGRKRTPSCFRRSAGSFLA